ncbi:MAG: hypothetical protein HY078_05705 [Elusimicrobia bacterium]|nr:hypothetical protein [Elusimicrobiota bacterium]
MRMCWVVEDYELLARLLASGAAWNGEETSANPGRLVLRLRRGLQLSQRRLSELSGVPRSLIIRTEAGRDIQISSLRRLLKGMGCGLAVLPVSEARLKEFEAKAMERRDLDRKIKAITSSSARRMTD